VIVPRETRKIKWAIVYSPFFISKYFKGKIMYRLNMQGRLNLRIFLNQKMKRMCTERFNAAISACEYKFNQGDDIFYLMSDLSKDGKEHKHIIKRDDVTETKE
jgi:hypothetical protein